MRVLQLFIFVILSVFSANFAFAQTDAEKEQRLLKLNQQLEKNRAEEKGLKQDLRSSIFARPDDIKEYQKNVLGLKQEQREINSQIENLQKAKEEAIRIA